MHRRKISVIGLGYVGLPVAVAFGKLSKTIGFDVNEERLSELRAGRYKKPMKLWLRVLYLRTFYLP